MLLGTSVIDLSGVSLPFSIAEFIDTAMQLLGLVGPFVLLGIALMFAPRFINLIRKSFGSGGKS